MSKHHSPPSAFPKLIEQFIPSPVFERRQSGEILEDERLKFLVERKRRDRFFFMRQRIACQECLAMGIETNCQRRNAQGHLDNHAIARRLGFEREWLNELLTRRSERFEAISQERERRRSLRLLYADGKLETIRRRRARLALLKFTQRRLRLTSAQRWRLAWITIKQFGDIYVLPDHSVAEGSHFTGPYDLVRAFEIVKRMAGGLVGYPPVVCSSGLLPNTVRQAIKNTYRVEKVADRKNKTIGMPTEIRLVVWANRRHAQKSGGSACLAITR